MLGNKALALLPRQGTREAGETLRKFEPVLNTFTEATDCGFSLFQLINRQFRTAPRAATAERDSLVQMLPALERIVSWPMKPSIGRDYPLPGGSRIVQRRG